MYLTLMDFYHLPFYRLNEIPETERLFTLSALSERYDRQKKEAEG